MNNSQTVKISPIGLNLHLICGDHVFITDFIKEKAGAEVAQMALEKIEICDGLAMSAETDGIMSFYFICDNQNITAGIIVHEAYHILNMCFKYIFYEHQENDELEAYMMESIFEQIHDFLEETKSK